MPRFWLAWLLACSILAGCAGQAGRPRMEISSQRDEGPQLLLVLLRSAPDHLEPIIADGTRQGEATGDAARERLATQLAHDHGLVLIDRWPVRALGAECFVMRAAPGASAAEQAAILARDARVESAEPVQYFRTLSRDSFPQWQPVPVPAWQGTGRSAATGDACQCDRVPI
ncbi:hypothetical protein [Dyella sp.]|uniref:hypothetical protein n=1 Tax=Dyella sp. TaxID=1869338 RepID=UPI002ED45D1F